MNWTSYILGLVSASPLLLLLLAIFDTGKDRERS